MARSRFFALASCMRFTPGSSLAAGLGAGFTLGAGVSVGFEDAAEVEVVEVVELLMSGVMVVSAAFVAMFLCFVKDG